MTELNTIRDIAREALIVSANGTDKDHSLWDCAQRLARSTEHICKLPELSRLTTQIDMFCLITAAYFSNAAFAGMQKETPAQNDNDAIAAICTRAVSDKLGGILDPIAVKRVNRIITESFSRSTSMPEAMY